MAHFRFHYVILLLLTASLAAFRGRFLLCALCGVLAAINLAVILPLYLRTGDPAGPATSARRAMLVNVNTQFGNPDRVRRLIEIENPDYIVIEEVSARWEPVLQALKSVYPYQLAESQEDNFGIALLSKTPWTDGRVVFPGVACVPSVCARVLVDGCPLWVVGTHPVPPAGAEYARYRDDQLEKLPAFLRGLGGPVLLLGDLNATPWSWHFRRLLQQSGLRDSARGLGLQPTWPSFAMPFGIPIDHCLHSPEVVIKSRRVAGGVRSDHRPVVADFALRR